ncbi:hypothetical protein HMPREF1443_00315 [Helicobacter pylori HP250BFi]|nr:hypothetical protein HMPREF1443_00315 [Helicobacter pylori HP250BFi]
MQLPIGFCGVQVVANSEQSRGLAMPFKISPHLHALFSLEILWLKHALKTFSAS